MTPPATNPCQHLAFMLWGLFRKLRVYAGHRVYLEALSGITEPPCNEPLGVGLRVTGLFRVESLFRSPEQI